MKILRRFPLALAAIGELGLRPLWHLGCYQLGLRSGLTSLRVQSAFRRARAFSSRLNLRQDFPHLLIPAFPAPLQEAEEIAAGQVRLFGGPPRPLNLSPVAPLQDWSAYETGHADWGVEDPKFIWEPARFGWVAALSRMYLAAHEDRWPEVFWQRFEEFTAANPPGCGPNWASGQEVALRLMAFCFAARVFSNSPASTSARLQALTRSIAIHAARIGPTLSYAHAQGNNHLISEAAGLYTAGIFLAGHPTAARWRHLGWSIFHRAVSLQVAPDGTYAQHSLNYHRLMLDLSLWMFSLAGWVGDTFPQHSLEKLALATGWLYSMTDPATGLAPNLGSNDGAQFLPLSACSYSDQRPTLQAACRAFLGGPCLPPGDWDEFSHWLGLANSTSEPIHPRPSTAIHRLDGPASRAFLRVVEFTSRPNHADQLHLDLWFGGQPITLDAGTYRYSASPPWGNTLAGSLCHNTLTVDGQDQMRRAGKFLWLRWAQSRLLHPVIKDTLSAETDAYRQFSLRHRRTLKRESDLHWVVRDEALPTREASYAHIFCVHWLLPDVSWQLEDASLVFSFPAATVKLTFSTLAAASPSIQVIRAGVVMSGSGEFPATLGWYSPTYDLKLPALSVRCLVHHPAPLFIQSEWQIQPTIE